MYTKQARFFVNAALTLSATAQRSLFQLKEITEIDNSFFNRHNLERSSYAGDLFKLWAMSYPPGDDHISLLGYVIVFWRVYLPKAIPWKKRNKKKTEPYKLRELITNP